MICPECKNELRETDAPTIYKCNNSKCTIYSIIVSRKNHKIISYEKTRILNQLGFNLK